MKHKYHQSTPIYQVYMSINIFTQSKLITSIHIHIYIYTYIYTYTYIYIYIHIHIYIYIHTYIHTYIYIYHHIPIPMRRTISGRRGAQSWRSRLGRAWDPEGESQKIEWCESVPSWIIWYSYVYYVTYNIISCNIIIIQYNIISCNILII
jgi:hypothetical protein